MIIFATDSRMTCSNNTNLNSSRSHAIFQIKLANRYKLLENTISIIDLAGSERTCSELKRNNTNHNKDKLLQKETNYINKSLTTLGRVINILSDTKSINSHIPFRDSKLTMALHVNLSYYILEHIEF